MGLPADLRARWPLEGDARVALARRQPLRIARPGIDNRTARQEGFRLKGGRQADGDCAVIDRRRCRCHRGNQRGRLSITGLGPGPRVPAPWRRVVPRLMGVGSSGRTDATCCWWASIVLAPAYPVSRGQVMLPPELASPCDGGEGAQSGGRTRSREGVDHGAPVGPHCLRAGVALGCGCGEAVSFPPCARARAPRWRPLHPPPHGGGLGEPVERRPQRFAHQVHPVEGTHSCQDRGGSGPWPSADLEQPQRLKLPQ